MWEGRRRRRRRKRSEMHVNLLCARFARGEALWPFHSHMMNDSAALAAVCFFLWNWVGADFL